MVLDGATRVRTHSWRCLWMVREIDASVSEGIQEREKEDWFRNQSPIKATQAKKHDGPTLLRINPF